MQELKKNLNNPEALRLYRKANQAWELAGCARQDGDRADELRYTGEAREFERLAREAE